MSRTRVNSLRPGYMTIRKGNRRYTTSYWAQGGRFFTALAAGFLLVFYGLAFVWVNHQAVETGYEITTLNQKQDELVNLNRMLKVEIANLASLERLERIARDKLGLVSPRPEQIVVVE